jgi:hypothetical protein
MFLSSTLVLFSFFVERHRLWYHNLCLSANMIDNIYHKIARQILEVSKMPKGKQNSLLDKV